MSKPLRVKITGDMGNSWGVDIFDALTGERLTNVIAIDMHLERSPADSWVTLKVIGAEIDIEADALRQCRNES